MVPALSFASMVAFFPAAYAGPQEASAHVSPSTAAPAVLASASVDATAASHCARAGELMGSNCSYTTGMMARRVLEEGQDWSFIGQLTGGANNLVSMVAAPYTASEGVHVIANELVELMAVEGHTAARLSLAGKLLEVDGVRYVVLTSFKVINA
ncbi:MAG: hypothetical protein Q8P41_14730 [Pseudomonadota bacterium]|nr:hypothetical protein [Pseudomonadota bacterium]